MRYVGIQSQQDTNNTKSILLLVFFPLIILAAVWMAIALFAAVVCLGSSIEIPWEWVNDTFLYAIPWTVGIVGIWFIIAYFWHSKIIESSTGAVPLERRYGMRVYNITENLCMRVGMNMPKLYIVNDPAPNAFASGINEKTYAVTVTTGLLNILDDRELAGVIAHELTHIRNRDTRLLITSIVFVGIVSMLMSVAVRLTLTMLRTSSYSRKNNKGGGAILFGVAVIAALSVAYFFTSVTRFSISRKREYMADAGAAELCGEPWALASALNKIAVQPGLEDANKNVSALFIAKPGRRKKKSGWWSRLWSTHPDIDRRIAILYQF